MKYGIYYSYWEKNWGGDPRKYIRKVRKLGFDVLELACADFPTKATAYFRELRKLAESEGVLLSGGYGPIAEHNLASDNPDIVQNAFRFWDDCLQKMEIAGIDRIGGALYSYWPVDFSRPIDKKKDSERSVKNMKELARRAREHGVTLMMESLNRFEGYMINSAAEAVNYVKAVDADNVKVMLDTFHMNIEEDSLSDAVLEAGKLLGHMHVGEANRKPPYAGSRMPWKEIGEALQHIGYDAYVVMEPFVLRGGKVGQDISIWRDLFEDQSTEYLDRKAAEAVAFLRGMWG